MSKQFICDIKDRTTVDSVFLVKEKTIAMAKNGKPYMNLRFMDKSGEVDAKIWDNVDEMDKLFDRDDFVLVRGKASIYLNKMQVVVSGMTRVPDSDVTIGDFLPESSRTVDEMLNELTETVNGLVTPQLRALMELFLADDNFMRLYSRAPAAKGMHHVYVGGLLEHSLSLVTLVKSVAPLYGGLNEDLLVAGALLHDVGKIHEMSFERAFDYTDEGKLIGHITIGIELVGEKIRQIEGFPAELAMLLKHMLLSHHGQYEFGSPKRPKTVEATLLHYLDDMDSKINGIRSHIAKEQVSKSRWTAQHRLYNLYFFKGNGMEERCMEECVGESAAPLDERAVEQPESSSIRQDSTNERQQQTKFAHVPFKKLENMSLF